MLENREQRREREQLSKQLTAELHRTNPTEYARIKADLGFTKTLRVKGEIPIVHYVQTTARHDSPTLIAMGEFSKERCERWVKSRLNQSDREDFTRWVPKRAEDGKDNMASYARLEKENPAVFDKLQAAAVAHGVLADRPRRQRDSQPAKQADDGRVPIGERLGAVVGLDAAYRVTSEQYLDVLQFANQQEAAKAQGQ